MENLVIPLTIILYFVLIVILTGILVIIYVVFGLVIIEIQSFITNIKFRNRLNKECKLADDYELELRAEIKRTLNN